MIVCIGDLLLDILILPDLKLEEQSEGIVLQCGGSAANTAAWLAWQGLPTSFVGCVGDDAVGGALYSELESIGVACHIRRVANSSSGCVAVEVTPDGERVMRSARGANGRLAAVDVEAAWTDGVVAVHLTGYALLAAARWELLHAAAHLAGQYGGLLSFDPSSVGVIAHLGVDRLLTELRSAKVGLLLPNAPEAEALSGEADPLRAADQLGHNLPLVVVKNGSRGAIIRAKAPPVSIPTVAIEARDTTGAGDAFNSGILAASVSGRDMIAAVEHGHRVARQAITRYGGRPPVGERPSA